MTISPKPTSGPLGSSNKFNLRFARHPSTMAARMVFRLPTRNFTPLPLAPSLETLLRS